MCEITQEMLNSPVRKLPLSSGDLTSANWFANCSPDDDRFENINNAITIGK